MDHSAMGKGKCALGAPRSIARNVALLGSSALLFGLPLTRGVAVIHGRLHEPNSTLGVDSKPKLKISDRNSDSRGEEEKGFLGEINPFAKSHKQYESFECGMTVKAHSKSYATDRCPADCPYFAQDKTDTDFCTFSCVRESDCVAKYPEAQIGDEERGICRPCMVDHCKQCDITVTEDRCAVCHDGYSPAPDGHCYFDYAIVGWTVLAIVGVVFLLAMAWVIDMAIRPSSNAIELRHAEASRFREKIHMDADAAGRRALFPLGTNLHRTLVAGPGMMLHFNFQLCIIIWAAFVASVWMLFAKYIDEDLWTLGTRKYGTPRDNCILVAWGYETQQRLMWSKVLFLWIVYIVSFVFCFIYGVCQLRSFQNLDATTTTMKDFAAMLDGLPGFDGSRKLEDELKESVADITGQRVVGVSVAWNHKDEQEEVGQALEKDLQELLEASNIETSAAFKRDPNMGRVRTFLHDTENKLLGLKEPDDNEDTLTDSQVTDMLRKLKSAPRAIVVFETEDARDTALEKVEGGFEIPGIGPVEMTEIFAEPDSVQWEHFGHSHAQAKLFRIVAGFGAIIAACLFWAVVFYAPYAYYVLTFDYSNGREPGPMVGLAFSMIVVIGNAIMYEVCARISDWVGFRFRDNREACYMILYTIACMFNVVLDFVTTYITQEIVLDSLGFRNYHGVPLRDIDAFTEKFETYGMQRALAENAFTYAFPSTFLIPFLIEWIPTMVLPWYMGTLIVRNHPEVRGIKAEQWLEMVPMDMGRYADILLNVILGILIFYFPGGYTWSLFLGMAGSHLWIYIFDYYKVLRQIPHCDYVAYEVEWWCQAMFAPIIAIIASSLAFKSNCQPGYPCVQGVWLILMCFGVWLAHCGLHIAALVYVVPTFGKEMEKHPELEVPFWHCAQHIPASWFTANPVFCLRSKYIYKHSPPCDFFYDGKEDLMRENPDLGCHFKHRAKGFRMDLSARGVQPKEQP